MRCVRMPLLLQCEGSIEEPLLQDNGRKGICRQNIYSFFSDRNAQGCIVYLIYATLTVCISDIWYHQADRLYSERDDPWSPSFAPLNETTPYREKISFINEMYVGTSVLHVVNAFQFLAVWLALADPITGVKYTLRAFSVLVFLLPTHHP